MIKDSSRLGYVDCLHFMGLYPSSFSGSVWKAHHHFLLKLNHPGSVKSTESRPYSQGTHLQEWRGIPRWCFSALPSPSLTVLCNAVQFKSVSVRRASVLFEIKLCRGVKETWILITYYLEIITLWKQPRSNMVECLKINKESFCWAWKRHVFSNDEILPILQIYT